MKRGMIQLTWMAVCLLSWLSLTTACSREESEDPAFTEDIAVFTAVSGETAGGEGEEVKACLLFWQESDYHKILNDDFSAEPFLVSKPDEIIDYYNVGAGVPYNTHHSYPLGDRLLHVCGFAPASLLSADGYRTLTIPKGMQDGKTDFLSGDGNRYRVGKVSEPFVADSDGNEDYVAINRNRQLEFCHLTSKIVVKARRSEHMLGRIGVRRINVTLHDQKVPQKLVWKKISVSEDEDLGGYFPVNPQDKDISLNSKSSDPLVQTMEQRVDSCYVIAGNNEHFHQSDTPETESGEINMTMDITAELIPVVNGAYDYDQSKTGTWRNVAVTIHSNTGSILKMGYKYEIIITFDIKGVRLQGVEMEWDEGGTHYIPIVPNPDKEENNP